MKVMFMSIDSSTQTTRCKSCGAEYAADLLNCPVCGKSETETMPREEHRQEKRNSRHSPLTMLFFSLIFIAFIGGTLVNFTSLRQTAAAVEVAVEEVVETPEPTIPPTPRPTPTVSSVQVYAFGRELDSDGFTAYVGDKPFMLYAVIDPAVQRPVIDWSMSDSDSASLTVSSDGMSCEFSALKPSGRNELTVRCYGAETVIPVYLWER